MAPIDNHFFRFLKDERIGILLLGGILSAGFLLLYYKKTAADPRSSWQAYSIAVAPRKTEINAMQTSDWENLLPLPKSAIAGLLRYKERLGGFYSIEQIQEAIPLTDSTVRALKAVLSCDGNLIRKIKVEDKNKRLLFAHPYIGEGLGEILLLSVPSMSDEKNIGKLLYPFCSARRIASIKKYIYF